MDHGQFTAENIKGSTFKVYEAMGHNMPKQIIPVMVRDMLAHLDALNER
jgi:hypothetical protein